MHTTYAFSIYIWIVWCEKDENKQKEAGLAHIKIEVIGSILDC